LSILIIESKVIVYTVVRVCEYERFDILFIRVKPANMIQELLGRKYSHILILRRRDHANVIIDIPVVEGSSPNLLKNVDF